MKLYNQTKNPLRWKINMTDYICEPWGAIEVPDMFVEHCKVRGLPLGVSPVAPEVKADQAVSSANDAARKDEILALQHEIAMARASEGTAKTELEKALIEFESVKKSALSAATDAAESKRKHAELVADHSALTKLLDEQVKKTTEEKQKADRAESTVAQLKGSAKQDAKQDKK